MVIIYCLAVILECLLQEFFTSVTTGLRGQAQTSFERQKNVQRDRIIVVDHVLNICLNVTNKNFSDKIIYFSDYLFCTVITVIAS